MKKEKLVLLKDFKLSLQYSLLNFPGAIAHAYLEERTLERLLLAKRKLHELSTEKEKYDILVWDAFRNEETQQYIFDLYVTDLVNSKNISIELAKEEAKNFVNPSTIVYPHGTGGAIDLTLLINGEAAEMGTMYDEFSERSSKDFFRINKPNNPKDKIAHKNREILRGAMEFAGFIGLDNEWWHYEWGTKFWGKETGLTVVLDDLLNYSPFDGKTPAYIMENFHMSQPVWFSGIAQVFETYEDRANAIQRKNDFHYYARTSNPSVSALGNYIKENVVKALHVSLVSSGLSACRISILALMPKNGVLICDNRIYYEVATEIDRLALEFNWKVFYLNFSDVNKVKEMCKKMEAENLKPDVFYFDSPINWWLDCIDLEEISEIANTYKAKTIADVSVMPYQENILKNLDVVAVSLSKYPSLGLTLGGAILTNNYDAIGQINLQVSRIGDRLSSDTAVTIWNQVLSLRDRLLSLSLKVKKVSEFLSGFEEIEDVRLIKDKVIGDNLGGMLVFTLKDKKHGKAIERVVAQNLHTNNFSIHLAFTFGSAMTNIEHFNSNPRLARFKDENVVSIPDNFVRLSLGCEPVDQIISDLNMVLTEAFRYENNSHYEQNI